MTGAYRGAMETRQKGTNLQASIDCQNPISSDNNDRQKSNKSLALTKNATILIKVVKNGFEVRQNIELCQFHSHGNKPRGQLHKSPRGFF